MSYYSIETWTIRDVARAFNFRENDSAEKKVVIPIFQRGLRWDVEKRMQFIDSLDKGYPFGSLLFAKQEGLNRYSVVDGLQRGSTVCNYVFNPLDNDNFTEVDDKLLNSIRNLLFPDNNNLTINKTIREIILNYFHKQRTFDKIDLTDLADDIYDNFATEQDARQCTRDIKNAISPFFRAKKERYENICNASVPIVVYTGPQDKLNEIFNRINRNGIALNDYEIYAATWSQQTYTVNNVEVVEKVIKKYWVLSEAGYEIDGFDATAMRTNKQLTAFEFLFGLGKYWHDNFWCLEIDSKIADDDVNEISFEIVDACISQSKSIAKLDKSLMTININKLQRRIEEAIKFVSASLASIATFKGNKRKFNVLHSKYQIVSMIAFVFREMYDINNLDTKRPDWNNKSRLLTKYLPAHYVADIISNEWREGGGAKVYTFLNEKKYLEPITLSRWESLLDNYFESQLQNKQNDKISNPVNADSVILNCIYVNLFTADDQLSEKKFDIEHLATKERMKQLLSQYDDLKLPIACIANLCYLPQGINRGKKEKTIYEAGPMTLPIEKIEEKYSFTTIDDLSWIEYDYSDSDRDLLEQNYMSFINNRYRKIKTKLLQALA